MLYQSAIKVRAHVEHALESYNSLMGVPCVVCSKHHEHKRQP